MADYRDSYDRRYGNRDSMPRQSAPYGTGRSQERGSAGRAPYRSSPQTRSRGSYDPRAAAAGSRGGARQEYYEPITRHPSGRPKTVRQYPEAGRQDPRQQGYGYPRDTRDNRDYGYRRQATPQDAYQGEYEQYYYPAQHRAPERKTISFSMPQNVNEAVELVRANPRIAIAAVGALVLLIVIIVALGSCVAGAAKPKEAIPAATDAQVSQTTQDSAAAAGQETSTAQSQASGDAAGQQTQTAPADQTTQQAQQAQATTQVTYPNGYQPNDVWLASIAKADTTTQYNSGGVEDPWSPTGWFTTGDAELDQLVKAYADANATAGMDAGDNAYYTYLHVSWWEYVENDQNQRPWDLGDQWTIAYAKRALQTYEANCYDFAAVLMYIMRYYGYADAVAEPCLILKQSGAWGDHGLVFLTSLDGRPCVLDASLSANGWLLEANALTYQLDTGYRV